MADRAYSKYVPTTNLQELQFNRKLKMNVRLIPEIQGVPTNVTRPVAPTTIRLPETRSNRDRSKNLRQTVPLNLNPNLNITTNISSQRTSRQMPRATQNVPKSRTSSATKSASRMSINELDPLSLSERLFPEPKSGVTRRVTRSQTNSSRSLNSSRSMPDVSASSSLPNLSRRGTFIQNSPSELRDSSLTPFRSAVTSPLASQANVASMRSPVEVSQEQRQMSVTIPVEAFLIPDPSFLEKGELVHDLENPEDPREILKNVLDDGKLVSGTISDDTDFRETIDKSKEFIPQLERSGRAYFRGDENSIESIAEIITRWLQHPTFINLPDRTVPTIDVVDEFGIYDVEQFPALSFAIQKLQRYELENLKGPVTGVTLYDDFEYSKRGYVLVCIPKIIKEVDIANVVDAKLRSNLAAIRTAQISVYGEKEVGGGGGHKMTRKRTVSKSRKRKGTKQSAKKTKKARR